MVRLETLAACASPLDPESRPTSQFVAAKAAVPVSRQPTTADTIRARRLHPIRERCRPGGRAVLSVALRPHHVCAVLSGAETLPDAVPKNSADRSNCLSRCIPADSGAPLAGPADGPAPGGRTTRRGAGDALRRLGGSPPSVRPWANLGRRPLPPDLRIVTER